MFTSVSKAHVASSKTIMGGFLSTALAILIRCFCLQSLLLESPTFVCIHPGNFETNSHAFATFSASIISSSEMVLSDIAILFLILSLKRIESWVTSPISQRLFLNILYINTINENTSTINIIKS